MPVLSKAVKEASSDDSDMIRANPSQCWSVSLVPPSSVGRIAAMTFDNSSKREETSFGTLVNLNASSGMLTMSKALTPGRR